MVNKDLEELLKRPERQNHSELIKELEKLNDPYENAFLSREELNEVCKPLIEFYNQTYTNYKIKNLVSKGKIVDTYSIFNNILSTKTHILNLMNEDLFQRICNEILRTTTPFNLVSDNAIGPFVTSLINNSEIENMELKSNRTIPNFGYYLKNKKIKINSNLSHHGFCFIKDSKIEINGDILQGNYQYFLEAKNSEIEVNGNIYGNNIGDKFTGNELIIRGDFNSESLGNWMKQGKIILDNNCKCKFIGLEMDGGEILIKGNVDCPSIGAGMNKGIIDIQGTAYSGNIGLEMDGGKINIGGNANGYIEKNTNKGKIYVQGKIDEYY